MISLLDLEKNQNAKNTSEAYQSDWRLFEAWADEMGFNPLPASEDTLIAYLLHMGNQGYKFSSITRHFVSIRVKHTENGFENLITDKVKRAKNSLRLILAKKRAEIGEPETHHATVMDRSHYEEVIRNIDMYDPLEARNKAIFSISYAAGLRVSEVLGLTFADISLKTVQKRRIMFILIRKSKTDQRAQGQMVRITAFEDKALCPIAAFENWQRHLGRSQGYIFVGFKKNRTPKDGNQPIERQREWTLVKQYFGKAFSPHSFRSSNVTHASDRGATIQEIMKTTRHSHPNSVLIYLDVRMMDSSGADYLT